MTVHPSPIELRNALEGDESTYYVQEHMRTCLACRVRYSRIAQEHRPQTPAAETIQRIIDASEVVPGIRQLTEARPAESPEAGELWRVGQDDALLVWVRKNFHDGAVDVVPVVLDVDLADEHTVLVPSSMSPLHTDLAAVATLRTHLHPGAFIDRVGTLDIAAEVDEVVTAQRTGRPISASTGSSIHFDDDERLEYRQALRDLLADLTPSAWQPNLEPEDQRPQPVTQLDVEQTDSQWFKDEVTERLITATCIPLGGEQFTIRSGEHLAPFFKVAHLDTAVLVVMVASVDNGLTVVSDLASACNRAARSHPDADAVCVVEQTGDWSSVLFSRASLRDALELPSGSRAGPVPLLVGLGVVDTLWKYLEGSPSVWETTDETPGGFGAVDVASIASRHVHQSIGNVEGQGRRALQEAKKTTWTNLHPELASQVAQFVTSVTGSVSPAEALSAFDRKTRSDQNP